MPIALPQAVRTLLEDKAYGHVVTLSATGQPRVTMVWMDVDGDEVLFNTAEGRKKLQDLRRDPRVIVSVQDRNNPQAYAVFHGKESALAAVQGFDYGPDGNRIEIIQWLRPYDPTQKE